MALTGRPASPLRRPFNRVDAYRRPSYLVAVLAVLAVLLIGEAPVAAYQVLRLGRIYNGVHAIGVDLGGKTPEEARQALQARFNTYARGDFKLKYGDRTWDTTPGELGVRLDVDSLVAQAMAEGRRGVPFEHLPAQLDLLLRGRDLNPIVSTDSSRLTMVLGALAHDFDHPLRNARLEITEAGEVELLSAQDGTQLDVALTAARFLDSFRFGDTSELTAVVHVSRARLHDEDLAGARRTAETMLAGDAVLTHGGQEWTWSRPELARAVAIEGQDTPSAEPIVAVFRDDVLVPMAEEIARQLDRAPRSARLSLRGATVTLEPSVSGVRTEIPLTVEQLKARLLAGERQAGVVTSVLPPETTDAALEPARRQAERILAGPLVLRQGDSSWTWTPEQLAAMLVLPGAGSRLAVSFDPQRLQAELARLAGQTNVPVREVQVRVTEKPNPEYERVPVDRRGSIPRSIPVYEAVPGAEGREIDAEALADLVRRQAESDQREIEVPVRTVKPKVADDAMQLAVARANRMVAAPMTLRYGPNRWDLAVGDLAALVDFWSAPNVPDPRLSRPRLVAYLEQMEDAILATLPEGSPPVGLDIDQAVNDISRRIATDNRTVDVVLRLRGSSDS